ncbi:MAG TPA: hypothetical protein VJB90_06115 [Candidatus Nanoarchaeia archaeon]|nr:hypothetical protein [Candidatus Nanoarchaeia archaeon]
MFPIIQGRNQSSLDQFLSTALEYAKVQGAKRHEFPVRQDIGMSELEGIRAILLYIDSDFPGYTDNTYNFRSFSGYRLYRVGNTILTEIEKGALVNSDLVDSEIPYTGCSFLLVEGDKGERKKHYAAHVGSVEALEWIFSELERFGVSITNGVFISEEMTDNDFNLGGRPIKTFQYKLENKSGYNILLGSYGIAVIALDQREAPVTHLASWSEIGFNPWTQQAIQTT